eukprot:TRINITY_DN868_c0_g1_i7.p1 TRINITY_DN868_c0_g1~~TRINITY_DN868_c0_g1_i7.p1  ORF type:complete len:1197 (-),score=127.48 TRINITY_DN868_c0_g1_i7:1298-4888(-)
MVRPFFVTESLANIGRPLFALTFCRERAGVSALGIFSPGEKFPTILLEKSILASGFDFSLSNGELEAMFAVAGAASFKCTAAAHLADQDLRLLCEGIVPAYWDRSGSSVYLTLSTLESTNTVVVEAHLVGYVFLSGQEVTKPYEPSFGHHHHDHGSVDRVAKRSISIDAHELFVSWIKEWSDSGSSPEDISRGISLAKNRLNMLRELAQNDADAACRLRLPLRYRAVLPSEVRGFVEEPIDEEITLTHIMEDNFKERKHRHIMAASRPNQPPFDRISSGHRAQIRTDRPVPVWGFIIDKFMMVISSSAARAAEPSETFGSAVKRSANQKIVVVGGKPIVIDPSISVEEFGRHISANDFQPIPEESHLDGRRRSIMADLPSATAIRPTKTVLYIATNFADELPWHTLADRVEMMSEAEKWYRSSFFGKIQRFEATYIFLNVTRVPGMDHKTVEAEARNLTAPLDWNSFDHWAVLMPLQMGSGTGLGVIRGRGVWLWYTSTATFVHECGHNLGLGHSSLFLRSDSRSLGVTGSVNYGHSYDWMGAGWYFSEGFNAAHKERLGILRMENMVVPTKSGVYRVYAHDTGVLLDSSRPQAMRIPVPRWVHSTISGQYFYVVEMRNATGLGGVSINLHSTLTYTDTYLINLNPYDPRGIEGASLLPGSAFVDEAIDLVVTNLGIFYDKEAPYAELEIKFGINSQVSAITGSIIGPSKLNISTNGTIRVQAIDPAGGELLYTWFQGMSAMEVSPKTDTVTVRWNSAGNRTVSVRVSDHRGRFTIFTWIVQVVGSKSQNRNAAGSISGYMTNRITGAPVVGGVVYIGDLPTSTAAMTDATGFWMLENPPIGNQTVKAVAPDCIDLIPSWGSDVVAVVAQNGSFGNDWTCKSLPSVEISALVAALANGTTGEFRLTRSGGQTSAALNVTVICDCENSAAWVNGNNTFPARWNVLIPENRDSAVFPVKHWRMDMTDPRHMLLRCFVAMSPKYKQTTRYRDSIRLVGTAEGPQNDDFASATVLSGIAVLHNGTFNNASTEVEEPSRFLNNFGICPSVWARWIAPGSGMLSVRLNTTYDATVQIHLGTDIRSLMVVSHLYRRDDPLLVPAEQGGVYNFHISSCSLPKPVARKLVPRYNYTLSFELLDPVYLAPALPPADGKIELASSSAGLIVGVILGVILIIVAVGAVLFVLNRRGLVKLPTVRRPWK